MGWIRSNKKSAGGGNYTDTAFDGSLVDNTYIDTSNGQQLSYGGWSSTNYIDIGSATILFRCGGFVEWNYNVFYDSNKSYISAFGGGSTTNIPSNAKYIRLSGATSQYNASKCKIFTPV